MTLTAAQTLARSMSEDELLRRVLDLLELHGWWAYHVRNSKAGVIQGQVGFPDLIALKGGYLIVVELKSERGKLTLEQDEWLRRFDDAGANAYCWRPSHYLSGRIGHVLGATPDAPRLPEPAPARSSGASPRSGLSGRIGSVLGELSPSTGR